VFANSKKEKELFHTLGVRKIKQLLLVHCSFKGIELTFCSIFKTQNMLRSLRFLYFLDFEK
jgi:hypothetical protein